MRKLLWKFINRLYHFKYWKGTAESYVREWYPESIALHRIFEMRSTRQHYWERFVVWTLPKR